jgi:VIT1/CCC1 family predicted Fe2+/Mn2+ transporter
MPLFRGLIVVLLIAVAVLFACYAFTGQERFKRRGLQLLKWSLVAAFGFFAVLGLEHMA